MASNYSKKHYQQFANMIVDARLRVSGGAPADVPLERVRRAFTLEGIALVEQRMIRVFELDNPNFNAEMFQKWTQAQD